MLDIDFIIGLPLFILPKDLTGYPFKFFKGCFPQILLDLLLNTLSHMFVNALATPPDTSNVQTSTKVLE